jgi:hypothetical protein
MPPISTKQKKVYTVMVNNATNINKTNNQLSPYEQKKGEGRQ